MKTKYLIYVHDDAMFLKAESLTDEMREGVLGEEISIIRLGDMTEFAGVDEDGFSIWEDVYDYIPDPEEG